MDKEDLRPVKYHSTGLIKEMKYINKCIAVFQINFMSAKSGLPSVTDTTDLRYGHYKKHQIKVYKSNFISLPGLQYSGIYFRNAQVVDD